LRLGAGEFGAEVLHYGELASCPIDQRKLSATNQFIGILPDAAALPKPQVAHGFR